MKEKYDDIYISVAICTECGDEIDEMEAHKHTFLMGGYPIYYHEICCPIEINGKWCKGKHFE